MKSKKFVLLGIIVPVALILFFYASVASRTRGSLDFVENLDEVAVTIDGEPLTLRDLIFYVLFEEAKVEEQARIYNPDSPKDYWNTHTNGVFIQLEAKEVVIEMAIHDKIMYDLAKEAHIVMTSDQKAELEKARDAFWGSLFEGQLENLPYDYEEGNRKIKEIAFIEILQHKIAAENPDITYAGLSWDGYDYAKIKEKHKVKIHKRIWDRINVGEISLVHENVNYINGLTDEEKEQLKEDTKDDRLKSKKIKLYFKKDKTEQE